MRESDTVYLAMWMENIREVSASLAFVVLRDFYGSTQLVVEDEELLKLSTQPQGRLVASGTVFDWVFHVGRLAFVIRWGNYSTAGNFCQGFCLTSGVFCVIMKKKRVQEDIFYEFLRTLFPDVCPQGS